MRKKSKIVTVTESTLVDMIENIVTEAVSEKKKQWISEQNNNQTKIIEEQIDKILDVKLKRLFNNKKIKK